MSTRTAIHIGLGTTLASWGSVALLRTCSPLEETPDLDEPVLDARDVIPARGTERAPPTPERSRAAHAQASAPSRAPRLRGPAPAVLALPEARCPRAPCEHPGVRPLDTVPHPRASE